MENFLKTVYTLNDKTRVKMLLFIFREKEVCVCDIENSFGMIQSRVSRHLKILKEGGFLNIDRRGKWAYYTVKDELCEFRKAALAEIHRLDVELPDAIRTCNNCEVDKK